MTLRRVTAATEFPVSLAEAKAQIRDDLGAEDALIGHYIAVANEKIGAMAGLVLGSEVWELTVSDPAGAVSLPLIPVASVVSVNGNDDVSGFPLVIDGDCASVSGDWPAGQVVIRFTVGGDVPLVLKQAMMLLIGHWSLNRGAASEETLTEIPYAIEALVSEQRRGWVRA